MKFDFRLALHVFATGYAVCVAPCLAQEAKPPAPPVAKITYDEHVRPIFREHCFSCHGPDKQESGLTLDSYQKTMAGGSSGEVVLAGDLSSSRLWALVNHAEEPKMPPKQDKLASAKLDLISKWIEQGAPENAGSKVAVKKNALAPASMAVAATVAPAGLDNIPTLLVKQPVVYTKRPGQITALAASPSSPVVAVSGQKQVLLYQAESGDLLGVLPFLEGIPHVLRFSRNGSVLLAAGGRAGHSGCVVLFDIASGKRIAKIGDELDAVLAADINTTHTLVALGGPSRVVRIYSVQTGELLHEIRKHTDWIYAAEFSPDGKLLATADRGGGLFVWEGDTAREVSNLRGHTGAIFDASWRHDSALLASAGEDSTVKLWDVNEGKVLKSWNAHAGGAFCVRFAHDGRLVTAGRDNTLKTWAADGAAQKSFPAFGEQALRCAFLHDGKTVIGGDWLGNVKVFDAADAKELRALAANPPTIAMRMATAKEHLATSQKAADVAASELAKAEGAEKTARQSLDNALAAQEAVAAARAALEDVPKNLAPMVINPETIKAAADSLSAASISADAAVKKCTDECKIVESLIVSKRQRLESAQAAIQSAQSALAAGAADQHAFEEHKHKLAAAIESAQAELREFQAAYGENESQLTNANSRTIPK